MPPTVPSVSGRANQAPWRQPITSTELPGAPAPVRTRPLDGLLTGVAASAVAGTIWWGVAVLLAKNDQPDLWHFGSLIVGLVIGQGVLLGTRRGGLVSGLIALVLSCLTVAAAVYFIDRSITIIALSDIGRTSDISLWQGWSHLTDTYRGWWELDQNRVLEWALAPLVAVVIAGWPGRRPIFG
jgi:hypothetical protein